MAKKLILITFLLVALAGLTGAIVYYASLPKNATEQLAWARERENKNNVQISKLKSAVNVDQAKVDELEADTDAAFQKVIDLYPTDPEAEDAEYHLIERARLAQKLSGRDLIARLEEFLAKYPETDRRADIMFDIAEIFKDDLDLKGEAINRYREFIENNPEHAEVPDALFEIGKIQESIGEFEAAEETYTELIENHPDHELALEAQYQRANLRADKLDKKDEAIEDFEDIEEKAPESGQGRVARARRQEVGRARAGERADESQEEYYGTREMGGYATPTSDWNDPTIDVIREQGADARSFDIDLWLDPAGGSIKAVTSVVYGTGDSSVDDTLILQFNGGVDITTLKQGGAEGEEVTFEQKGNFLHIALAETMPANSETTFLFEYEGTVDPLWKGDAVHEDGSYLRPESRWYPYLVWGDNFTVTIDITVPEAVTAIGPGLLTAKESTEDTISGEPGTRYSWKQDVPIGILAVVANEYEMAERQVRDGLLLQAYIYPEHREFLDLYLDELEEILTYYETILGPFPYERMAVAEIPFFPGGYGSPTLLMITEMVFKDSHRVVAEFLAHEVAHQWYGNLLGLTLEENSHPWLSEAFATYVDALYIEHKRGQEKFVDRVREMGSLYIESLVAFEDAPVLEALWDNPMYRTLAYEKGGYVIHMLRYVMGDEAFFQAMRDYIEEYSFKTVTVEAFQGAMEKGHGESLDWFFQQWLYDIGYPHYRVVAADAEEIAISGDDESDPTEDGASADAATDAADSDADESGDDEADKPAKREWVTKVLIAQEADMVFRGPFDLRVDGEGDDERKTVRVEWTDEDEKLIEVTTPFEPTRVRIDPDGWILKYPSIDDTEKDVSFG